MLRRVAIVGIDGSGKSVLVRALRQRFASAPSQLVAFHCPNFHEAPNAPLAELSSQLKALSDVTDELRNFELKLAALYLRMTLYGPVERFLDATFRPACLVSERHPLVDTLVYVPLYQRVVQTAVPDPISESEVREQIAAHAPGSYDAACVWLELENRRLGRDIDLWALADDIVAAFAQPRKAVLDHFAIRYGTTLPDMVVFLDVEVERATRRAEGRDRSTRELHEDERSLAVLRDAYETLMTELPKLSPQVEVRRVANMDRPLEETLEELLNVIGVADATTPSR